MIGLFGLYCWGVLAGFACLGLDDEVDDDGDDSEDDEEEEPDGAFDDELLDLRGNTFEFDSVDYVEDADGWSIVPNRFIVEGAVRENSFCFGGFFISINFFATEQWKHL